MLPRLHGHGIVRATGRQIENGTPIDARIVDRQEFEPAKVKVSASGFALTVPVGR